MRQKSSADKACSGKLSLCSNCKDAHLVSISCAPAHRSSHSVISPVTSFMPASLAFRFCQNSLDSRLHSSTTDFGCGGVGCVAARDHDGRGQREFRLLCALGHSRADVSCASPTCPMSSPMRILGQWTACTLSHFTSRPLQKWD